MDEIVTNGIITVRATAQSIANLFATSGNILGTANEIAVTVVGGVVTIGFSPNIIIPAPASGVTLEVSSIDQTSTSVNTAGGLAIDVTSNGTSVGSGGIVAFSANNSAWRFASIKGLVQDASGNSVGNLSFATRRLTTDTTLTEAMQLQIGGNVVINAPSSGATLLVSQKNTAGVAQIWQGTGTASGQGQIAFDAGGNIYIENNVASTNMTVGSFLSGTSLSLTTAGSGRLTINSTGNVTIAVPTSGAALSVNAVSGAQGVLVNTLSSASAFQAFGPAATQLNLFQMSQSGQTNWIVYQPASSNDFRIFGGSDRLVITGNGNVTINAPTSGVGLTVSGVAGSSAAQFLVTGVQVGSPTGGDQGVGTLNATQLYVNAVPVYRTGTFTATLTGCTTSPTVTATYVISGNTVTLVVPTLTGTSNSTSCTITGLPAAIQAATLFAYNAAMVEDNTTQVTGAAVIAPTTGTIILQRTLLATGVISSTGFTAAGTKGTSSLNLTYSLL
jgi:hypothetical protein